MFFREDHFSRSDPRQLLRDAVRETEPGECDSLAFVEDLPGLEKLDEFLTAEEADLPDSPSNEEAEPHAKPRNIWLGEKRPW